MREILGRRTRHIDKARDLATDGRFVEALWSYTRAVHEGQTELDNRLLLEIGSVCLQAGENDPSYLGQAARAAAEVMLGKHSKPTAIEYIDALNLRGSSFESRGLEVTANQDYQRARRGLLALPHSRAVAERIFFVEDSIVRLGFNLEIVEVDPSRFDDTRSYMRATVEPNADTGVPRLLSSPEERLEVLGEKIKLQRELRRGSGGSETVPDQAETIPGQALPSMDMA